MAQTLCMIAVVERGKADKIVDKAKEAGAKGATVFYGRGTGASEVKRFLNIYIDSSKEIIMILCEEEEYKPIRDAVVDAGRLKDPGTGVVFTLPIIDLIGLHHREEFNLSQE